MTEPTEKCAHQPCHCPALGGAQYCSKHCEQADNDPDTGACLCGHAQCQEGGATPAVL